MKLNIFSGWINVFFFDQSFLNQRILFWKSQKSSKITSCRIQTVRNDPRTVSFSFITLFSHQLLHWNEKCLRYCVFSKLIHSSFFYSLVKIHIPYPRFLWECTLSFRVVSSTHRNKRRSYWVLIRMDQNNSSVIMWAVGSEDKHMKHVTPVVFHIKDGAY